MTFLVFSSMLSCLRAIKELFIGCIDVCIAIKLLYLGLLLFVSYLIIIKLNWTDFISIISTCVFSIPPPFEPFILRYTCIPSIPILEVATEVNLGGELSPLARTLMQDIVSWNALLTQRNLQRDSGVVRGVLGNVSQTTDISCIQSQNSTVLSTRNKSLGLRVGKGDMSKAGQKDNPPVRDDISFPFSTVSICRKMCSLTPESIDGVPIVSSAGGEEGWV